MKELFSKLQQLLPQLKIRLRASVRRRLAIDIMALSTGLRGVAMLDYVPCTPPMLQQLCQLLFRLSQEVHEVAVLRVLDMEGCGYVIHPSYLLEYMHWSLTSPSHLFFVVLDDESPRKASQAEHEAILKNLCGIQQRIASLLGENVKSCSPAGAEQPDGQNATANDVIAAGSPTSGSGILLPTLNGWLLGYPVVYFFVEENASRAGRCVAGGAVQLHQVLVSSTLLGPSSVQSNADVSFDEHELLSFTVPSELSPTGLAEDWAQGFLQKVTESVERARNVWSSIRIEVTTRKMEFMVL